METGDIEGQHRQQMRWVPLLRVRQAQHHHRQRGRPPVTDDEEPTMANLVAAYAECNITITGFEAITLKTEPDQAEINVEN